MQNAMNNHVRPMRIQGFGLLRGFAPDDGGADHYVPKQGTACFVQRE